MREIEVKILEINPEEIRNKLKQLGAKNVFDGEVHTLKFDSPLNHMRKNNELLRVRKIGNKTELCIKGPNRSTTFKSKEEIQVTTSNFEDTVKIMEKMGFKKNYDSKKHRESYKLGNICFEIDTYPNVPTYLEIEAPNEEEIVRCMYCNGELRSWKSSWHQGQHYKSATCDCHRETRLRVDFCGSGHDDWRAKEKGGFELKVKNELKKLKK